MEKSGLIIHQLLRSKSRLHSGCRIGSPFNVLAPSLSPPLLPGL